MERPLVQGKLHFLIPKLIRTADQTLVGSFNTSRRMKSSEIHYAILCVNHCKSVNSTMHIRKSPTNQQPTQRTLQTMPHTDSLDLHWASALDLHLRQLAE